MLMKLSPDIFLMWRHFRATMVKYITVKIGRFIQKDTGYYEETLVKQDLQDHYKSRYLELQNTKDFFRIVL